MEKIGNDTFEHNGKTYKLIKSPKEGKSCEESCSLYNLGCEELCTKAYNELYNPNFSLLEAVFVEVDESENKGTVMKNDEIDWEKLYKEEHDRYEEMYKAEQMRLEQLASWYGALPDGDEKQFKKLEEIFPELAGNNDEKDKDEKIRGEIIHFIKGIVISNVTEDQRRMWIDWLEKQGKIIDEYEDKLDRCACENFDKGYKVALEKQGEQNPAWSEEDEKILERLIKEKRYSYSTCEEDDDIKDQFGDELDFLVSLKDRMTWRPTEKQMNALGDAVKLYKTTHFGSYHVWGEHIIYKLETLYNDLKKL